MMEEKIVRSSREERGLGVINLHSQLEKKYLELAMSMGKGNRLDAGGHLHGDGQPGEGEQINLFNCSKQLKRGV